MPAPVDFSGQRFGKVTVLGFSHRDQDSRSYFFMRCDCGKTFVRRSDIIKKASSCGSSKCNGVLKHGLTSGMNRARVAGAWSTTKPRCKEWDDLEKYMEWIYGNGYEEGCDLIVVRRDVSKPFSPENCFIHTVSTMMRMHTPLENKAVQYKGIVWPTYYRRKNIPRYQVTYSVEWKQRSVCGFFDPISAACCYDDIVGAINPGTAWLNRDHFPEVMEAHLKQVENNKALIKLRKCHPEAVKNLRFQELKDLYNTE